MEKKIYGIIYLLIDGTNDFEYVGQTTRTFEARFYQHMHDNLYVDSMIKEHGADMFVKVILKVCYSQEELDYWERHFIKYRETMDPNGYNLTPGGSGTAGENNPFFGKHHTEKSLAKMSESHLGNTAWVGKNHRKESKVLISVARRTDTPFKNLLAEMDKRNMSYKDLAEFLGWSQMTSSERMRGVKGFKAVEVAKLVGFFGLPAEYLMARDDGKDFSTSKNSPFKNLLMEMDKRKITYRELAKLLGFKNETSVSNKMSGKYNFTDKDIAKLVEIFEKPADYLMKRDDEEFLSAKKDDRTPFKNLQSEIEAHNLSYAQLSKLLGFASNAVSYKMRDKSNFTEKDIAKLVEIFGKPADYLMKRDE